VFVRFFLFLLVVVFVLVFPDSWGGFRFDRRG